MAPDHRSDVGRDRRLIAPSVARDTIFTLSSGALPAAIAVIRISGPHAGAALAGVAGLLPPPRRATLRTLCDDLGEPLDRAVVLWLPGPATATGEDIAELHLHGGRAVVAAVSAALAARSGLRPAEAGEFTRRAVTAGRLDLAEAEGLADLLAAETEEQRRRALRLTEGGLGRMVAGWRMTLLSAAAACEAAIDHGEELDETCFGEGERDMLRGLAADLRRRLASPPAERLRDGARVVIAGPVNAGKSSLLNALAGREAAIASPVEGTTRDLIEVVVAVEGCPYVLIDCAGLRDVDDVVERIGVARARDAIGAADLVLWLGRVADAPDGVPVLVVQSQADRANVRRDAAADHLVSIHDPVSIAGLWASIRQQVGPRGGSSEEPDLNRRHRGHVQACTTLLDQAAAEADLLLVAEHLRSAMLEIAMIVGHTGPEQMLDALFSRFCVGK